MYAPARPRTYQDDNVANGSGVLAGKTAKAWAVIASFGDGGRPAVVCFRQNRKQAEDERLLLIEKTWLGTAIWVVVQPVEIAV